MVLDRDWTVTAGIAFAGTAYVVGHIIDGVTSFIHEQVVEKFVGKPGIALLNPAASTSWLTRALYQPLPEETRNAILKRASLNSIGQAGEALDWAAFRACNENSVAMDRLNSFKNLSALCRNLYLVTFLAGISFWCSADYGWMCAAFLIAGGMFLRYLKFLRHYAEEQLTTFGSGAS
jgi:hypothetical protein